MGAGISNSIRLAAQTQNDISGIDPEIVGPVQTANPDFYGGDRADLLFGANMIGQRGVICGHRLAAEFGVPVYQRLNGPQLETDWTVTIGWQKRRSWRVAPTRSGGYRGRGAGQRPDTPIVSSRALARGPEPIAIAAAARAAY